MKKHVFGKKFNRDTNERKALFKSLVSSLVLKERIQTTETKAKAIKGSAEKAVTKAKKNGAAAKKFLGDVLNSEALDKLVNDIAPRFKNRNGGYTRIIRVGRRFGDNAMEVIMEWTEQKGAGSVRPAHVADAARPTSSKSKKTKSSSLSVRRTTKAKPKTKSVKRSASSPSASGRASRTKKGKE